METTATTPGWQLDERGARSYEAHLVPAAMDPWAGDLVTEMGIAAGEAVLDLGCGTGIVARHAVGRVGASGRVVGVDANPAMLAVAAEKAGGTQPAIEWQQALADALPFHAASFDAVCCQQALQFFPDPAAALAEVRRVLRPGGRFGAGTCRSLDHQPGYAILVRVVADHLGESAAEVIRSPYRFGDPDELRGVVEGAGFVGVELRLVVTPFRFPSAEALFVAETSSSPLGGIADDLTTRVRTALVTDLAARLRPHTDDAGVIFPFETVTVTARRR